MGTAYFADLVRQFGGAHFALATYNAGPSRDRALDCRASRASSATSSSTTSRFPETQNYVKRILGKAEDYRRLYGPGAQRGDDEDVLPAARKTSKTPPPSAAPAKKKPAAKAPAKKPTVRRRTHG